MSCPICGGETKVRCEDYQYKESGLPNVTLAGLYIEDCSDCGEELVSIPKLEELHRVLAFSIATQKTRLTGPEVRFLRKYLGWSGKDFAATMGVAPETVSRWENEKERIGLVSDRLLRTMVLRLRPVEEYPTERLSELGNDEGPVPALGLRIEDEEWRPSDRAA